MIINPHRDLVVSRYWDKRCFFQNDRDNDMMKAHIETVLYQSTSQLLEYFDMNSVRLCRDRTSHTTRPNDGR